MALLEMLFLFAGIVETYVIMQAIVLWILHVFATFWKVQFPFHSRYWDDIGRIKYVHAACVLLALLLPVIPPIAISLNGGFIMPRFPPIVCVGRKADATFYSFILPITIMLAVGTTLLLMILWRVRRVSELSARDSGPGSYNIILFLYVLLIYL